LLKVTFEKEKVNGYKQDMRKKGFMFIGRNILLWKGKKRESRGDRKERRHLEDTAKPPLGLEKLWRRFEQEEAGKKKGGKGGLTRTKRRTRSDERDLEGEEWVSSGDGEY